MVKKFNQQGQAKSTKRKGKVIDKPKSKDRNKKYHCKHPACESRQHIPVRWCDHKRNNPDHDNTTDKEECTGNSCPECLNKESK